MKTIILQLLVMVLVAISQVSYKLSINYYSYQKILFILFGMFMNFIGVLIYLEVLKKLSLNLAFPTQFIGSIVLVVLFSTLILNETFNFRILSGIALGISSVILINF